MRSMFFCLFFFVVCSSVHASVLSDYLTFDGPIHHAGPVPIQGGGEDKLQDDSLSVYEDKGQAGFDAGDQIWGLITLSEINSSGVGSVSVGANDQVMILYAAQISATPGSGGSFSLQADLGLLNTVIGSAINAPVGIAGLNANTIGIVLSTTTGVAPNSASLSDPLNWAANALFPVAADVWNWEATLDVVPNTSNFFEFSGNAALGGTDRAAGTISSQAFAVTDWLDVDVFNYAAVRRFGDWTLDIGTVNVASALEQTRGWDFRDQSTFFVNPAAPIPEPASILAWCVIGTCAIGGVIGRRVCVRSCNQS